MNARKHIYLTNGDGERADFVMLQECQRQQAGWKPVKEAGRYMLLRHQGMMSWRGTAIAVDARKVNVLKKKSCDRAVWVQIGDKATGERM